MVLTRVHHEIFMSVLTMMASYALLHENFCSIRELCEGALVRYNVNMKTTVFLGFFALLLSPLGASAYETTDQRAIKINETTAIYFIEYKFGHENHDFYMPVLAERDQEHGSEVKSIGFEVLEDGEEPTEIGSTQAIVLSNTPISNGMYKVPKGFSSTFTLAVILTTDEDDFENDYAIRVTDLPFYSGDDLEYMRLNTSELQHYVTDEIGFNDSNGPESTGNTISVSVDVKSIEYSIVE